ncbi:MAG: Regulatory protein AtoC [Calditrichaeota bacterium]|nr:Regulatory protein AtoC [Calditrichota bacterium]
MSHLLDKHAKPLGREDIRGFSPATLAAISACEWPGNVRQLENVITRAMVLAERDVVTLNELPDEIREKAPAGAVEEEVEAVGEPDYAENTLAVAPVTSPPAQRGDGSAAVGERGLPTFSSADELPTLEEVKAWITREAFEACDQNISLTAKKLGLGRATLYRQLEKYGIHTPGDDEGE